MPDWIDARNDIRGMANLWIGVSLLAFAAFLLWRGAHERRWIDPVPGRIVFGLFLLILGYDRIYISAVRFFVEPMNRSSKVESWVVVGPLIVCALMAAWSLVRFARNDLGDQHKGDDT